MENPIGGWFFSILRKRASTAQKETADVSSPIKLRGVKVSLPSQQGLQASVASRRLLREAVSLNLVFCSRSVKDR